MLLPRTKGPCRRVDSVLCVLPLMLPGLLGLQNSPGQATGPTSQSMLTNESVVKLVKAGLLEDTIVSMIETQPGKYSLGADDVVALKQAGVSDKIIAAMVRKPTTPAASAPVQPAPAEVAEVGVYYKKADEWVQMMPEVVNWKTGGVLKSSFSYGVVKPDLNGLLKGDVSPTKMNTPLEFLVYAPEGVEITEYQLIHLRTHKNTREFRTVTGGVFHASGGAARDTLPFEYKKTAVRTYVIDLSSLTPGEYGFLPPGSALSGHASAQLGKMYTFHLSE